MEMRTYEESLKTYWDNYSILETARNEGKQEGRREGKEEGMIEVAREMKKEGDPVEKISRITGLTKEQIEKL
jgi:predicted transposase/invertase (TIGR01784 family)